MKSQNGFLKAVIAVTIVIAFVMIINVLLVSVFKIHIRSLTSLVPYIDSVNYVKEVIPAKRGNIYDANGMTIGQDESTYSIVCYMSKNRMHADGTPAYVEDKEYTANVLASILEADQAKIYEILLKAEGKYQTEIGTAGRLIDENTKLKIEEYELPGVEFFASSKRHYPLGDYFSPYLVGFAQDEGGKLVGKMGVEQYLNDELSGIDGYRIYQADKNGYVLEGMREEVKESIDGYDVYLTLDNVIQDALQSSLEKTMEERGANRAWGMVVDVKTGKILGWGQTPSFNNNLINIEEYNNFNSQTMFEPGSVFKVFAFAAAMNEGVYDGKAGVDSSNFCYLSNGKDPYRTYGDYNYGCITNSEDKTYGWVEYDYGLIMSLNTVTSSIITDLIKPDIFLDYLYDFGFFQKVNTDGILENNGYINFDQPVEKLTATYGAGLTVNSLQLIQAYTAIFGNGEMLKPYYIDKIVNPENNKIIYEGSRQVVSKPISEETAKQMQDLLRRVVIDEAGTAKHYEVEGVNVMAKTGTQQIIDESGNYVDGGTTLNSVMLGFPYEDPQYIIYYAYQSQYNRNNHFFTEPITDLIKRVALVGGTNPQSNLDENNSGEKSQSFIMDNYIGHSLEYATSELANKAQLIILGDGDSVIDQYPKANNKIYNQNKVFLLTSKSNIKMPNIIGWSRKDVSELWSITDIAFTLDGYGIVSSQSINEGEIINQDSVIVVGFEDLKDPNAPKDSETNEEIIE